MAAEYEVRLLGPAETFLRGLEEDDREHVGRLLDLLEQDPRIDGRNKIIVMIPPVGFSLYADSRFWILYHIVQNTTVSVLNIDRADTKITPWR